MYTHIVGFFIFRGKGAKRSKEDNFDLTDGSCMSPCWEIKIRPRVAAKFHLSKDQKVEEYNLFFTVKPIIKYILIARL